MPAPQHATEGSVGETTLQLASDRAEQRGAGIVRRVLGWLATVLVVVAIWPAPWGGFTGLTFVQGQSMEPTYYTGDLVVTIRKATYDVGDVISFKVPRGQAGEGGRAIHRITEVGTLDGDEAYVTLGDNSGEPDPWLIPPNHVLGRAMIHVPQVGVLMGSSFQRTLVAGAAAFIVFALLWPSRRSGASRAAESKGE